MKLCVCVRACVCASVCVVCVCVCVGNLLIALILRHMHGHARLASCSSVLLTFPSHPSLSAFSCFAFARLPSSAPPLIYSSHPFTRNIHVRRSTALLNLLPDAVAAVASPRLLYISPILVAYCITRNQCVCVCVWQRVRASVDKAQKSYTC